ncbi:MAG: hypothetical protein P9X22_02380 [Candidatus Zapsychrus exili]|nr:hypothetical protein [Candidatus Zapsychrus exili]
MNSLLPISFIQLLAGTLCIIAAFFAFLSLMPFFRTHALRLSAIVFITSLSLFSNSAWNYFAAVFIIATAVTEIEFLQNLAAIIRGDKNYFAYKQAIAGEINPSQIDKEPATKSPMENKILNTLWTKQVNKFQDLSTLFTFKVFPNSQEFVDFRVAGAKLIGEELIGETPNDGNYHLTPKGYDYCKIHYREFGSDQWWPEEALDQEKLKKVLGE